MKRHSVVVLSHIRISRIAFLILVVFLWAYTPQPTTAQMPASRLTQAHEHMRKGTDDLKTNATGDAIKEFEAVVALDPRNAEAYANLGLIAFLQQDYRNASQKLRKAMMIDSSVLKVQALLGISESRIGEPSALPLLERSFHKLQDKPLRLQAGIELVAFYKRRDDTGRAVSVMGSLVDLDPDNTDILYMAQQLYGELAEDTLNKLAILAPASGRMQQVIAERLVNAGDLKEASERYRKALEISPGLTGVHYELAEAILESAPNDSAAQVEAEKELGTVISTEGDSAKVECELGRIATLRSDTPAALTHYTRAYQMSPQDSSAQLGLGRVLMTMEKTAEARKYLEIAVKSDPLNNEAHYRLALAYRRLRMTEQAEKEMHLFGEIKQTKKQVRELYREMNRQPKPQPDEALEAEQ